MYPESPFFVAKIFGLVSFIYENKMVNANTNYNTTHKIISSHNNTHAFISIEPIDDKTSFERASKTNHQAEPDTFLGRTEDGLKLSLEPSTMHSQEAPNGSFEEPPQQTNATKLSPDDVTVDSYSLCLIITVVVAQIL